MNLSLRFRGKRQGGHVHVAVFSKAYDPALVDPDRATHGKAGDIVLTLAEWEALVGGAEQTDYLRLDIGETILHTRAELDEEPEPPVG